MIDIISNFLQQEINNNQDKFIEKISNIFIQNFDKDLIYLFVVNELKIIKNGDKNYQDFVKQQNINIDFFVSSDENLEKIQLNFRVFLSFVNEKDRANIAFKIIETLIKKIQGEIDEK